MATRFWSAACAALVAGLLMAVVGPSTAGALAQKTQVPGYYRMALGNIEVTALFDAPPSRSCC
jgi:hypothetical protein